MQDAMINEARAQARGRLADLIQKVLADGRIDDGEKDELNRLYRQAVLTVSDVREVLGQYMKGVADEVLADGRVTDEERARCRSLVEQLKIPPALLSPELQKIVQ